MSEAQRHALRQQLQSIPKPSTPPTPLEFRAGFDAMMSHQPVRTVPTWAETLAGRPVTVLEPESATGDAVVLYFHGGWFIAGSPRTALALTAELAVRSGATAYSLDYRLAPEHPFPAAGDDAIAAYRSLLERGVAAERVVFAGDSAGGNLAVVTALRARQEGLPAPAGVLAFSPTLDLTASSPSMTDKSEQDPFFTLEQVRANVATYLDGADAAQLLVSPALGGDLTGLPPVLVQVGTDELLLDDSVRFTQRAIAAEVDITLDVVARVPHVFSSMVGALDEAGDALDRAALFVKQRVRSR